jgi:uncharacterized membrane protein
MSDPQPGPPTAPLYFNAVLHPHRSLGPLGFYILIGFVSVVSFVAGIIFALKGAWPVMGFFGLDALGIYVAFRLSYRSARLTETVQLKSDELAIARIQPGGRTASWSFHPFWVRINVHTGPHGEGEVVLTSHGRSVALGRFLTTEEREDFADALRTAIHRLRHADDPVT